MPMDSSIFFSHMDVRSPFSTRRYTYEGYGGQKHDKTLILHKSETSSNDTIVLRLCKRSCGRVTWSSCLRGKLTLATLMSLLALFCYFNLFTSYLPRTCGVFAVRSSSHAMKSVVNETVHIIRRSALSEQTFVFDTGFRKSSDLVSTFTKKVAFDMRRKIVLSKALYLGTSTAIERLSVTSSPDAKSLDNPTNFNGLLGKARGSLFVEALSAKVPEFGSQGKAETNLMSRLIKFGKSLNPE